MKSWGVRFFIIAVMLTATAGMAGADVTDIEIVDYGILAAQVAKTTKDQTLVQGAHHTMTAGRLLKRTTDIPARKGLKFGFTYLIKGYPIGNPVKIDFVVLYPEPGLTNPGTGTTDTQSMVSLVKKIGKLTATGYLFNQTWEMVPGKWTFQIWIDGRKLAEKQFTVSLP